jgi:hypothetical protein
MMVSATGFVEYNVPTTEFRIGGNDKLDNLNLNRAFISLNNTNCRLRGEGRINMSLKTKSLELESYGTVDHYILADSTRLHVAITLNFPFSEAALQKLSGQIESINLPGVTLARTPYQAVMESAIDPKDSLRLKQELELLGKFRKFPEQLEKTLVLADLWLVWDTATKSYLSTGPIGIGSVGKAQVNRYVNGLIEFTKKRNGDDLNIYLKLTDSDWFFFNYRDNILQVISSDLAFNDLVTEAQKSKAEQNRVDKLAKGFRYIISTDRKKREFLRKFETPEE